MTTTKFGGEALRIALEGIVAGETTAPIVEVIFREGEIRKTVVGYFRKALSSQNSLVLSSEYCLTGEISPIRVNYDDVLDYSVFFSNRR